jgi:hypothetical protein
MRADVSAGPADFICSSEVRQTEEVAYYVQNVWGLVHDEHEDHGGTVVKVLCYKSEGRWFDSRWCHWNFSLT